MQKRIIVFLGIYIAAQEATETTAPPLAGLLCLLMLDIFSLIATKKGLYHYLKNDNR